MCICIFRLVQALARIVMRRPQQGWRGAVVVREITQFSYTYRYISLRRPALHLREDTCQERQAPLDLLPHGSRQTLQS